MRVLERLMAAVCGLLAFALLVPVKPITPPMDVLYAAPGDLNFSYGPQGAALQALIAGDRPATATITVTYNGFSPQAETAFRAAVNIWAATITSPAPIRIVANWTPLSAGVLGSANASAGCGVSGGFPGATLYPAALADKIHGSAYCAATAGETSEITANFNSTFADWEFGTSGAGVPGKYNFMTVVLHEIAHGLGFAAALTSSGGIGTLATSSGVPFIYDRFAISDAGTPLLNVPRPSAELHALLTGNLTFWNSPSGPKLETHDMTAQYGYPSDHGFIHGSSYVHLDDVQYSGTPNGLMTFQLNANEVYTDVGAVVRTIFTHQGWTTNAAPALPHTAGDFSGDGQADFTVFRPSSGMWFVRGQTDTQWGIPGDIPVPGDYNGDGRTEIAVFRPSTGTWYLRQGGGVIPFGRSGDIPVPGDYNGDGVTDIAVFRTSDGPGGTWFIRDIGTFPLGLRGDIPLPADYDGDGKTDMTVFRPSTGIWYFINSATGISSSLAFGLPGDIPIGARFDADTRADFAVYRPSTGMWYLSMTVAGSFSIQFGLPGDIPLAQDTDGDGVAELNVWRPATGTWYTYNRVTAASASQAHGIVGDIPVMQRPRLPSTPTADFDGDGRADLTIYRVVAGVSYWYQRFSRTAYATNGTTQWGLGGDIKVPGDYDGDHKTDVAVFRPADDGIWYILQSSSGIERQLHLGGIGDVPMPADYDGDGRTDPAVYRPATGFWYALLSSSNYTTLTINQWGLSGDVPRSGDFDGDGRADFAVFRPANGVWYLKMTTSTYSVDRTLAKQFGLGSDTSVAQDFDGDGRTDLGLYRGHGQWLAIDALTNVTPVIQAVGLSTDTPDAHDYDGDGRADAAVWRPATGQWFIRQSSNGILQTYQWGLNGDQPVLRIDPWR